MISIRFTHHTDFNAVAGMMTAFLAQHHRWQPDEFQPAPIGFTAAIFQTWLELPNELHLTALAEDEIAGYISATRWSNDGSPFTYARRSVFVSNIVVADAHRRKGVGRALFEAVEIWADEYKAEFVGLHVIPPNEPARAFYAALGYDLSGEYRHKTMRRVKRMSSDA
jgi:GNAT superfamily N-acetyltransferase